MVEIRLPLTLRRSMSFGGSEAQAGGALSSRIEETIVP